MTATATRSIPTQGTWTPDLAHTVVGFVARHLVVTKVRGQFEKFVGTVTFDGEPANSKWQLSIETDSVNTGQERRDGHLRSGDFFDAEKYPKMDFVSTKVEAVGDSELKVTGDLTIKDVTRPVELKVELGGVTKGPMGEALPFAASTEISRDEWGLNWNVALEQGGWLVSPNIHIEIDGELQLES
jgi:polyisoprenoid-binding protein YceI